MCAKWSGDPTRVTEGLEAARISDEEGVRFEGWDYDDFVVLLPFLVDFRAEMPELTRQRIINQATFNAGREGKIDKSRLIKHISILEDEYLKKPPQRYVLLTTISERFSKNLRPIRLSEATISFSRTMPRGFSLPPRIDSQFRPPYERDYPVDYTFVRVSVQSRNEHEAADTAFDALDFVRGLWNYSINRRVAKRLITRDPLVNRLVLGPIHSVHRPNGKPAGSTFMYDPAYSGPLDSFRQIDWDMVKEEEALVRKMIRNHPNGDRIKDVFTKYGRAFDERNLHIAFIRLWGVLEQLGRKQETEPSNKLIDRVSFLYRDTEVTKLYLQHLRQFRNRTVHSGAATDVIQELVFQLKKYVEAILDFHLKNHFRFASFDEMLAFLELPPDSSEIDKAVSELDRRIEMLRIARKYRA